MLNPMAAALGGYRPQLQEPFAGINPPSDSRKKTPNTTLSADPALPNLSQQETQPVKSRSKTESADRHVDRHLEPQPCSANSSSVDVSSTQRQIQTILSDYTRKTQSRSADTPLNKFVTDTIQGKSKNTPTAPEDRAENRKRKLNESVIPNQDICEKQSNLSSKLSRNNTKTTGMHNIDTEREAGGAGPGVGNDRDSGSVETQSVDESTQKPVPCDPPSDTPSDTPRDILIDTPRDTSRDLPSEPVKNEAAKSLHYGR